MDIECLIHFCCVYLHHVIYDLPVFVETEVWICLVVHCHVVIFLWYHIFVDMLEKLNSAQIFLP